ncbi:TPA_asm: hypothetical protein GZJ73_13795 [Listeria monocytogenes]|nr:hypothetical protein [Listeria monocytogenes]HAC2977331.1 hypothetical protein [Listeria monocytogenes]
MKKIFSVALVLFLTFSGIPGYVSKAEETGNKKEYPIITKSVGQLISKEVKLSNGKQVSAKKYSAKGEVIVAKQELYLAKNKKIKWKITPLPPYRVSNFKGTIRITDLRHGGFQNVGVAGMRGSISQPMLKSLYRATLTGVASPGAHTLGSSYIQFNN